MKKNLVLFAFIGLMLLFGAGLVWAILSLAGNKEEKTPSNQVSHINLEKDRKIYDSKIEAYNQLINDSITRVRNENVKVNLNQLWKKKTNNDTAKTVSKMIADYKTEEQPKTKPNPKPKPKPQSNLKVRTDTVFINNNDTPKYKRKTGFKSSFDNKNAVKNDKNIIKAVVHKKQRVSNGSAIKLRFTEEFKINGITIPEGTFFNGVCQLSNERVIIRLASFAYNNQLFSLHNYSAYDPDGWKGIYVKDLVVSDALNEAVNQTTAQTQIDVPILGNVALNTARKENNVSYVTLASDYPIFLKTDTQ